MNFTEEEEKITTNLKTKLKKRKVKAWCGECFHHFENGPLTKICKEHLNKGKCNLIDCKKNYFCKEKIKNCIRKFPNVNSENRHTYCITEEEIKCWDEQCKLQNCLGVKRQADINYEIIKSNSWSNINKNNIEEEKEINFSLNFDNLILGSNFKNYTECNLIDEINNLNLFNENFSIDENLIDSFKNIDFNTPDKIENIKESKSTQTETKNDDDNINENLLIVKNKTINNNSNVLENIKLLKDDENIDQIFEKVHIDTKIPKLHLNKLKSAFKKKGIFTAKILRLFRDKYKNLDFLIDEFKKICSRIEGVALFLENILKN